MNYPSIFKYYTPRLFTRTTSPDHPDGLGELSPLLSTPTPEMDVFVFYATEDVRRYLDDPDSPTLCTKVWEGNLVGSLGTIARVKIVQEGSDGVPKVEVLEEFLDDGN